MPDIEKAKQDAASVVSIAKSAEAKVTGAIRAADAEAMKAKQAALAKLNQEETWMEKNPGKVALIVMGLLGIIIALLAKGCA